MSMKTSDRIMAAPRGTISGAKSRAKNANRNDETMKYIDLLFHYAVAAGVDPAIAFAQWDVETDTGKSGWWTQRLNPAGIGITGWKGDDEASWFFTPETAAKAQIAHLMLYATGKIDKGGLTPKDDPRYNAYVKAYGEKPTATTIQGLSGRWAVDTRYANKIVSRSGDIWPILDSYDIPTPEKTYAPISIISNIDSSPWIGKQHTIAGRTIIMPQRRTVTVTNLTKARRWGTIDAEEVSPPYKPGDTFKVYGFYFGTHGDEVGYWWITEKYHRVWAGDTFDKPVVLG